MAWQQFIDIYREGLDFARDEVVRRRQACPVDGEPLREGPDGRLYCPFDGWTEG